MKDSRTPPYLKYLQFIVLLAIVLFNFSPINTFPVYAAAPANDAWQNATVIGSIPFNDAVDTNDAQQELDEPVLGPAPEDLCNGVPLRAGLATVWYKYVAPASPASRLVAMDTLGSNQTDINPSTGLPYEYDTYIAVYTGTPSGNPTLVACNDDNNDGFRSQLGFTAVANTTYYIQVAQYNGQLDATYQAQPYQGGNLQFHVIINKDTVGVFRPSNGALYLKNANITGYADVAINYGVGGDYPVVGDWDGNGTATIGIYRNGVFYLRNANTVGYADIVFAFGAPGDQPVAGDWNNDGIDTVGVYRSSAITFYLRNSNSAGAANLRFSLGNPGDVGIAGDWNGDGFDTTGVFRPSNGALYLKNTNTTGFAETAINYGIGGDQPVTGDWNNDGTDTIGVYRNATFYLRNSNTIGYADIVFALGIPGDMPIAGNWDGLP